MPSWFRRGAWVAGLLALGALAPHRWAVAGGGGAPDPKVELGRRLFFDPAVSRSGENACSACHDPDHAFSSPRRRDDDDFLTTRRHGQTLEDVGDAHAFHWDGEFDTIEELVTARLGVPPGNQRGYGAPPVAEQPPTVVTVTDEDGVRRDIDLTRLLPVAQRVERDGRYAEGFVAAFGAASVTAARLAEALGAYVKAIRSTESAYDRFARGDATALSPSARRGLDLFRGRAGCVRCHEVRGDRAPFTDRKFHNTGVTARSLLAEPAAGSDGPARPDRGLGRLTSVPRDDGLFHTPTLRDVARRPPYMHDGSFATLEEVVRHYAQGATRNPNLDPLLRPFHADDGDVADLVALLGSLTSEVRPALAPDWRVRARTTRVRLLDAAGRPLAGIRVGLEPAGDGLPGDGPLTSPPGEVVTDALGWFEYAPPRRTHVRLALPEGLRLPQGPMVPDTCERLEVRLPVQGLTDLLLLLPAGSPAPRRLVIEPPRPAADRASRSPTEGAGAEGPVLLAFRPRPVVFVSDGTAEVAGVLTARYRAWLPLGAPRTALLPVAVGDRRAVREVTLVPGGVTHLDLTAP